MKALFQSAMVILLFGLVVLPAQAAFTSLYVFGDALSTTTNNLTGGQNYYGQRYSNGRVWVEVLAQEQGIPISNNLSYFDCDSGDLVANVNNFTIPPTVSSNALVVIWVNNSDIFDLEANEDTTPADWTAVINQSQINHLNVIANLYAQGVRTFLMPNAVDVSRVPYFNNDSSTNFFRQECIAYDAAFSNTLNYASSNYPGIKIYSPNFFALLDNVLANSSNYGLTNMLYGGIPIDAIDAYNYGFTAASTNGYGTNYVFWDDLDPTAAFHAVIADVAQQVISPVKISKLAVLGSSNRLDVVNMPLGLNGLVLGSTNLAPANWIAVTNGTFSSTSLTQSIFVVAPQLPPSSPGGGSGGSGSIDPNGGGSGGTYIPPFNAAQFYRLQFPYAWTWP